MASAEEFDDATGDSSAQQYCSFAVTGAHKSFQAVYICQTCSSGDELLCLCQACADSCHADCDGLDYVGMGKSYCDCNTIGSGCIIQQSSLEEASRIVGRNSSSSIVGFDRHAHMLTPDDNNNNNYIMAAYTVPALTRNNQLHQLLCRQAQELVKHSRETFWIDEQFSRKTLLSELEQFAWKTFQCHSRHYKLDNPESPIICGAEWWVQVKPISYPKTRDDVSAHMDGKEAIDLHFDKDEVLAESFGLGVFPTLASVTYLTHALGASPTMVVSRCYDQQDDEPISTIMVSHPRRGKHIIFDGALLHGAPSHYALREPCQNRTLSTDGEDCRITLLVNLWMGHHPAGVEPLDEPIRDRLQSLSRDQHAGNVQSDDALTFEPQTVPRQTLRDLDDLDSLHQERIKLPFLSKGATWVNDDGSCVQTFLSTFAPPLMDSDETTFQCVFGPGLEAMLVSQLSDGEDENDGDDGGTGADLS